MKLTAWEWAAIGGGVIVTGGALFLAVRLGAANGEPMEGSEEPTPGTAEQLAAAAGVPLGQYCLARAIVSEAGGLPRLHEVAIGCACLNFARSEFPSLSDPDAIVRLVLGTAGVFGRQGTGGRRVSSSQEPARLQLSIAADVLTGNVGDPTDGSTQWDSPRGQRALAAQGDPLTTKTPEQVAERRASQGYELVVVAGIDPDVIRFWRLA